MAKKKKVQHKRNKSGTRNVPNQNKVSNKKSRKRLIMELIGCIFFVVGGILFGTQLINEYKSNMEIVATGTKTEGTVEDVQVLKTRGEDTEKSTISYVSYENRNYFIDVKQGVYFNDPTLHGEKVTVYYRSENPNEATVQGWGPKQHTGYVQGLIPVILGFGYGYYCVREILRKGKSKSNGAT